MNGLIAPAILVLIVGTFLFFYLLHHKDEAMSDTVSLNKEIVVHGYWLDNGEQFSYPAVIGDWDESQDDDGFFYYFDSPEEVIGTHNNEFHIHSYEEISHD